MGGRAALALSVLIVLCASSRIDSDLCLVFENLPRTPLSDLYRRASDLGKAHLYIQSSLLAWLLLILATRLAFLTAARARITRWAESICFVWLTFCVTGVITDLVKALVGRARPDLALACSADTLHPLSMNHLFQSFPSGHTQTVFTFALLIGSRTSKGRWPALLFAILIAGTRLYRNVHFVSDVLGGVLFSLIGLWVTRWLRDTYLIPKHLTMAFQRGSLDHFRKTPAVCLRTVAVKGRPEGEFSL